MKRHVSSIAILAVLAATFFAYTFMQSQGFSPAQTSPTIPATFVIKDASLELPQSQPPCQGLFCTSSALLSGTVFVDANSPLACLDSYVNGTSEGSNCWNLASPVFTTRACSGSGSDTSCIDVVSQNTNTQTIRTASFNVEMLRGSNSSPNIIAGRPYLVSLVAHFQDGSSSTTSTTVIASISDNYSVAAAPAASTTTYSSG